MNTQSPSFRFLPLLLFSLLLILLLAVPSHGASAVRLMIDDIEIATDVPPEIKSGRTLVPARAVFGSVGGDVEWDPTAREVLVDLSGKTIKLTIDSTTAYVDGNAVTLDVPAQIINSRTLIPVRFVSESVGYVVRWDESNRIVKIYTDPEKAPPLISNISAVDITATAERTRVTVTGSEAFTKYTGETLSNPFVYYIDIAASTYSANVAGQEWQREFSMLIGARGAQNTPDVSRLAFDLREYCTPTISLSADKKIMYIDFPKPAPFNPWADGKLMVVLDAGHGAETGGKRSPDSSLMEYEFNRDMANRVKAHLERHGVQVLLTADTNADVSLEDRCKIANESGADIFVSLHANAYGSSWSSPTGWEIYTYKKGSYSEQLAKSIHDATIPSSGLKDRGVKAERFYVIRNTNMPAVLVEHGFYSNKEEVELLKSAEFRETLAICDAKGILNFLGVSWID